MIWTVHYRNSHGKRDTLEIDASTRDEIISDLKRRGLVAISISQGATRKHSNFRPRLTIVALVVIPIVFLLILAVSSFSKKSGSEDSPERNKKHIVISPQWATSTHSNQPQDQVSSDLEKKGNPPGETRDRDLPSNIRDLPSNIIETVHGPSTLLPTPKAHDSRGRKPIFENEIHAMLANYSIPGVPMPPPERVSDAVAIAACAEPILDSPDDDDATLKKKEAVRVMQRQLKEYLDSGKSANEFFADLDQRQEMESIAVAETRSQVLALVREGRLEDAEKTLSAYNEYLKSKGMLPVEVKQLRVAKMKATQNE